MSWWDTSSLTSFASQATKALKNAQKKIDKVLEIDEGGMTVVIYIKVNKTLKNVYDSVKSLNCPFWIHVLTNTGPSWPWSSGSWIYNYLCNQCLSPLIMWVRISIRARYTTLCDKVCQWLVTGRWFSPGPLVSSTNKTDRHDITEILLKVALNTIKH